MAEVSWIKLRTDMFDDIKIKILQSLPEGDALLVIWIRLITLAGTTNRSGYVCLNENIPFTEEMLSVIFNKPLNTIKLALTTFQQMNMIEIDNKGIYLINFEKHQNMEALQKIREQNKIRSQNYRDNKKPNSLNNVHERDDSVTQPLRERNNHAIEIDKEEEKERDKEEEKERDKEEEKEREKKEDTNVSLSVEITDLPVKTPPFNDILLYWNNNSRLVSIKSITDKRKKHLNARIKEHSVEAIYNAIDLIANSKFMHGDNNRNWIADFDWVFSNPNNFIKVLEGKYQNRNNNFGNTTLEDKFRKKVEAAKQRRGEI